MKINSDNTNLNLRHLRAIHAIWQEGNFVRAADRLGLVPSALSEIVRQTEEIAGGRLFDRRSRPPAPTPLGIGFLEDTRPVLAQLDEALGALRDRALGLGRSLHLGASPSVISGYVAPALIAFRAAHPDVAVTLADDVADVLAEKVAGGELDLAIAGRSRSRPDLVQHEIGSDPFGLACHRDHPLARRGSVTLDEIGAETLIHLGPGAGSAGLIGDSPRLPAALKRGALRCSSTVAQLCLVRGGAGVAILPRNAVALFNDPAIAFVAVSDLQLRRQMFLLSPARREIPEPARAFMALLPDGL